jgi:predicted dinucleotide-binding enzyme
VRIGIVGTGVVGRTLADGFRAVGHEVTVGTRDPEQTRSRTEWSETALPLVPYPEVATDADVVINATSGAVSVAALGSVGADQLRGKVLLDASNPLDFSSGFPPTLLVKDTDSLAEQIQRAFPEARVVKAFNTMSAAVMVNPAGIGTGDTSVFVAGNDATARKTVSDLARDLGWSDVIDLGDLTAARGLEMWLPLWVRLMGYVGNPIFNIKVNR